MSNTTPLNAYAVKERGKGKQSLLDADRASLAAQIRHRLQPRARSAADRRQIVVMASRDSDAPAETLEAEVANDTAQHSRCRHGGRASGPQSAPARVLRSLSA